jgi:hypothetical protein
MAFTQIFGNFSLDKAFRLNPHNDKQDDKSCYLFYQSSLKTRSSSIIPVTIRIYQSTNIPPLQRNSKAFVFGYFIYDMVEKKIKVEAIQIFPYEDLRDPLTFRPRVTIVGHIIGDSQTLSHDVTIFPINTLGFVQDFLQVNTVM